MMDLEFDQNLSFLDNLALFRKEAERIDADCARILFDNLQSLMRDEDGKDTRQAAVKEFNEKVLAALDVLPKEPTS